MPYAGDNITEGYALRATPPATRLSFASALLLSEAAAVLSKEHRFSQNTPQSHTDSTDNQAALC